MTSTVKIYAFNDASPHSLSEGIEIGTVDYSGRSLSHSIRDSSKLPGQVESVVILVDEVHSSQTSDTNPQMQIAEVQLVGW